MAQIALLVTSVSIMLFPVKQINPLVDDLAHHRAQQEYVTSQVNTVIQSRLYDYIEGDESCTFRVKLSKDGLIKVIDLKNTTRRSSCVKAFKAFQNRRINRPIGEEYRGLIIINEEKLD
ncbi:hypothetical protein ABRI18_003070 [Vibrio fluvialis]